MKKGFTLAEVLITLGIIGIVAALTIPGLIADYQEKANIVKLKKIYSMFQQAYALAEIDQEGGYDKWNLNCQMSDACMQRLVDIFYKPYFKISKICKGTLTGCYVTSGKKVDGTAQGISVPSWYQVIVLIDGTVIYGDPNTQYNCNSRGIQEVPCAWALVDVNGSQKPNRDGVDRFQLEINQNGIRPLGVQGQTTNYNFENGCLGKKQGIGCTAWAIYNENMDYLRCNNLSWTGKTKCD
jgi:prepilin-type N-terminal cleavage/methylation domain-containing protein